MTSISTSSVPGPQPNLQGSVAPAPSARAIAPTPTRVAPSAPASPAAVSGPSGQNGGGGSFAPSQSSALSMPNAKEAATKVAAQAAQASQATRQAIALQAQQAAAAKTEPLIDVEELRKKVDEAISRLNDQLQESQTKLGFQVDQATDSLVIKVMNKQTGELVRQIPTEVAVRLLQNPNALKGLLFDEAL